MPAILSDHALACRLERAEGISNARFVEARARLDPASGAQWIQVAGAYAMFDGPRSPCTQTFGLGLSQHPASADMDRLESFFHDRGAPAMHEICALAGKAMLPVLNERHYHPVELSDVMFLPLDNAAHRSTEQTNGLRVRVAGENDAAVWTTTLVRGWSDSTDLTDLLTDLAGVSFARENGAAFLVELDDEPIAAGALAIHEDIAQLAGACTVPEYRGRGAQRLLFQSRLEYAARHGCSLAMFCAEPGSSSHRNAQRQGFRFAYSRLKWALAA
jgi:GNAT superfamily N-acetyltransferase